MQYLCPYAEGVTLFFNIDFNVVAGALKKVIPSLLTEQILQ